jgi:Tfp pilus assembly PilM family ATPase
LRVAGNENHTGFTLTSAKVQLVEVNLKNEKFILQNVDEAYFDERLNLTEDKETKITSILQTAFNELLIRNRLSAGSISFTLPVEMFYTVQIPYDNTLLYQDLLEEIRWELSILFPFVDSKEVVIQHIEIEKNKIVNRDTILVSALRRKYLQMIKHFCDENNLALRYVDNSHFASERALSSVYNLKDTVTVSLFVGSNHLSLIFSLEGKPVLFKTTTYNSATEIPDIILKETSPSETVNINRSLIDSAYISGEDISDSFVNSLNSNTGIEFKRFNPFENISPDPRLLENNNFSQKFNTFSPAAGIAYRLT